MLSNPLEEKGYRRAEQLLSDMDQSDVRRASRFRAFAHGMQRERRARVLSWDEIDSSWEWEAFPTLTKKYCASFISTPRPHDLAYHHPLPHGSQRVVIQESRW
uniref:Uncharacterized protein n=1 Tax=Schistocephalus solidus TaxID=70667 RepID=A0A0X3NWB1_SCHSO